MCCLTNSAEFFRTVNFSPNTGAFSSEFLVEPAKEARSYFFLGHPDIDIRPESPFFVKPPKINASLSLHIPNQILANVSVVVSQTRGSVNHHGVNVSSVFSYKSVQGFKIDDTFHSHTSDRLQGILSDPENEAGDVVRLARPAHKLIHTLHQMPQHTRCIRLRKSADRREPAVFAEFLAALIERFHNAIGVQDESIAGAEFDAGSLMGAGCGDPQRKSAGAQKFQITGVSTEHRRVV